jgi:hypothetical protein
MYNNEVTYAPHWNTPENKAALEKLESKYFDKSEIKILMQQIQKLIQIKM